MFFELWGTWSVKIWKILKLKSPKYNLIHYFGNRKHFDSRTNFLRAFFSCLNRFFIAEFNSPVAQRASLNRWINYWESGWLLWMKEKKKSSYSKILWRVVFNLRAPFFFSFRYSEINIRTLFSSSFLYDLIFSTSVFLTKDLTIIINFWRYFTDGYLFVSFLQSCIFWEWNRRRLPPRVLWPPPEAYGSSGTASTRSAKCFPIWTEAMWTRLFTTLNRQFSNNFANNSSSSFNSNNHKTFQRRQQIQPYLQQRHRVQIQIS